ncbi:MAG TPA: winged helix DNA-binding domain-containing protein [Ktedonobacteraceae bacterium]|nr:winged helix DNA-binding domain-containing protein [Chthonomonadales bacterium]HEV2579386.1 winged helix DNA-binding domain-containing protein [Ktedonobacteraceae bacterium]
MSIALNKVQTRFLRQYAQRLTPRQPGESAAQVVKDVCGIQAQDARAAALSIRSRGAGLVAADIEQARVQDRSIARAWGPRGTLHLLASEDLGWLLMLFGPVFIAGDRARRLELGLDDETSARGVREIRDILADQGPLTRDELVEQLAARGLRLEGQARPHLIFYAALQGILCLGPDRGSKPTYVLLDDWLGHIDSTTLSREAACAELARRYISAYGPASRDDMAAWSGLPISEIRAAWKHIANSLLEVEIAGQPAWMLKSHLARLDEFSVDHPIVHLLAAFDTYLLGYRSRDMLVEQQYAKRINAGGGMIRPALLVDGRAAGTWQYSPKRKRLDVLVVPFEPLASAVLSGMEEEVGDVARFLEIEATALTILSE